MRWTERRVGAVSWGFTEDRSEGLGLWEPLHPDLRLMSLQLGKLPEPWFLNLLKES